MLPGVVGVVGGIGEATSCGDSPVWSDVDLSLSNFLCFFCFWARFIFDRTTSRHTRFQGYRFGSHSKKVDRGGISMKQ